MGVSRRSFLGLGAAGLALLAVGGVGIGLRGSVLRAPSQPLRALDERSFSILAAMADRMCPGGDGFPTAAELQTAENVDALLATCHPGMVAEVKQALLLFENGLTGLVFDLRPTPFTHASPTEQDEILAAWRTSSLMLRRQVFKALRGLIAGAYYGHPDTYAAVGYPGPPDFTAFLAEREAERAAAAAEEAAEDGGEPLPTEEVSP